MDADCFFTREPVTLMPFNVANPGITYAGWPHDKPGYIVWFEPNIYKQYLSPNALARFADLEIVYHSEDIRIFSAEAR